MDSHLIAGDGVFLYVKDINFRKYGKDVITAIGLVKLLLTSSPGKIFYGLLFERKNTIYNSTHVIKEDFFYLTRAIPDLAGNQLSLQPGQAS